MSSSFKWEGLDELRAQLRQLPTDLAGEASEIVMQAAERAKADMQYPRRTGDLADHVTTSTLVTGVAGAGAMVKNSSPLAFIFEHGTQARHTELGANRGSMPPGHVFVPAVVRSRRRMWDELKALLVRHGLMVSGDA